MLELLSAVAAPVARPIRMACCSRQKDEEGKRSPDMGVSAVREHGEWDKVGSAAWGLWPSTHQVPGRMDGCLVGKWARRETEPAHA